MILSDVNTFFQTITGQTEQKNKLNIKSHLILPTEAAVCQDRFILKFLIISVDLAVGDGGVHQLRSVSSNHSNIINYYSWHLVQQCERFLLKPDMMKWWWRRNDVRIALIDKVCDLTLMSKCPRLSVLMEGLEQKCVCLRAAEFSSSPFTLSPPRLSFVSLSLPPPTRPH